MDLAPRLASRQSDRMSVGHNSVFGPRIRGSHEDDVFPASPSRRRPEHRRAFNGCPTSGMRRSANLRRRGPACASAASDPFQSSLCEFIPIELIEGGQKGFAPSARRVSGRSVEIACPGPALRSQIAPMRGEWLRPRRVGWPPRRGGNSSAQGNLLGNWVRAIHAALRARHSMWHARPLR